MDKLNNADLLAWRLEGLSYSEIAKRAGISKQRVYQRLSPPLPVKTLVRERAKAQCEQCGCPCINGHVHHRQVKESGEEDYNDIPNLQYLCPSCHYAVHHVGQEYNSQRRVILQLRVPP